MVARQNGSSIKTKGQMVTELGLDAFVQTIDLKLRPMKVKQALVRYFVT